MFPRRDLLFRTVSGQQTSISSAEILLGAELVDILPASGTTPALYEVAATLDGERRVLLIPRHLVDLQEDSPHSVRE
ncbi:hypothetical protein [Ktedonobacter sp. SOSP1-52]|uniref:hypothetical protein n=1 Tax=Ktedonobacter sp. SOSP1-52 TaxID=2778366 RepID=UPI0019159F91|nr:hypothetical protein [Ktedonobacter sp. SOSP1-52]